MVIPATSLWVAEGEATIKNRPMGIGQMVG